MFNLSPKWNFPSNNHSQIIGIADSGVEMFKGTPIKSLAREICQNSLDARLDNAHPARLEFETFTINPKTIPDSSNLEDAFERSRDFWKIQDSTQARNFFKRALKDMNANTIKCLRISDFNTSGLTGSRDEYNSPWCNLTKSSGASNKSGSNGGSFGIGKFAPFACSSLRTVFYSTYDVDNISASQGVARLTTFKNKKKETTQGIGFYGCDKNSPMYNQYSLNPNYTRPEKCTGTDIFIAGFTGETGWEHQMVASILDGFLYAIYTGSLVVDVDGITINKETLPDLMDSHKEYFKEHADEYYRVLTDNENARSFTLELIFYHPMNKSGTGAQRLFDGNVGLIYPDFISRNSKPRIIADAKYKPLDNIGNRDYLQVLAYMFRFDAKAGYYLYPEAEGSDDLKLWLNRGLTYEKNVMARDDISVIKHGFKIHIDAQNYSEFTAKMKVQEQEFTSVFYA